MDVTVVPASSARAEGDDRWSAEVVTLRESLKNIGQIRMAGTTEPGQKGGAEVLILAIGTAGLIPQMVEGLRVWLARDRSRSAKVTWTEGGEERTVELSADPASDETLRTGLLAAIEAKQTE